MDTTVHNSSHYSIELECGVAVNINSSECQAKAEDKSSALVWAYVEVGALFDEFDESYRRSIAHVIRQMPHALATA